VWKYAYVSSGYNFYADGQSKSEGFPLINYAFRLRFGAFLPPPVLSDGVSGGEGWAEGNTAGFHEFEYFAGTAVSVLNGADAGLNGATHPFRGSGVGYYLASAAAGQFHYQF
jgi:hypothetical protein